MATGFGVTFMLAHEKRTATCFFMDHHDDCFTSLQTFRKR
eukprot:UN16709